MINLWYPSVKQAPIQGYTGFGGGATSLAQYTSSGGGGNGGSAQGDGNTGYSTTDLILNLDPTDSGSYGGSGTTWYNIASGSLPDFTISGATFDSGTNGGLFDFDGSNDHAYSSSSINLSSYNYITVDVMLRHDATNAAMIYVEHSADWNGGAYRWGVSSHNNGNDIVANRFHTNHNSVIWWDYDHSGTGTGWANHVNQFSKVQGNTRKTYVNGTQMTSANTGDSQGQTAGAVSSGANFGDHVLYIGGRGGSSVMFNGKIGFVRIYGSSSEISSSTISDNYDAVKSNYGLS